MDDEAALLAELRAISSNPDRFDKIEMARQDADDDDSPEKPSQKVVTSSSPSRRSSSTGAPQRNEDSTLPTSALNKTSSLQSIRDRITPPWKKNRKDPVLKTQNSEGESTADLLNELRNASLTSGNSVEDPIVVMPTPDTPMDRVSVSRRDFPDEEEEEGEPKVNNQEEIRSGEAHDPELLELLKGASRKNAGSSRFDEVSEENSPEGPHPPQQNAFHGERDGDAHDPELSELHRAASTSRFNDDVEVVPAAPTAPRTRQAPSPDPVPSRRSPALSKPFLQQPSTFQGDRGGDAHDPELLALLRGVSNANSRFQDEPPGSMEHKGAASGPPTRSNEPRRAPTPDPSMIPRRPPSPAPNPLLQQPSTYQGDRGGSANDPELLALLRGASNANSRFNDGSDPNEKKMEASSRESPVVPKPFPQQKSTFTGTRGGDAHDPELLALLRGTSTSDSRFEGDKAENTAGIPVAPQAPPPSTVPVELTVTKDDLPDAWKDKNWKVRLQAYEMLNAEILSMADSGPVEASKVMESLDESIPSMLADTNAGALDKAIELATSYAEHCPSAGTQEQSSSIALSLVQKNALSSRPSTLQAATELALKLVEVACSVESAQEVVSLILTKGGTSKKPKIVLASVSIVVDAVSRFGAICLPIDSIVTILPKLLGNTNVKVREKALALLSEICRSMGKTVVQSLLDDMKKAQLLELESMLESNPEPSEPSSQLRCLKGSGVGAQEMMEANMKDLAKRKFEEREPVDLLAILPRTDFQTRIHLSKWSEKVEALKLVLETAGETPYKLVDQSPSSNYAPLISEMKKLLSHTHFAVVSKAMEVISMLSQGVGERLFPFLRPLVSILLALSKDKKLTKGVGDCLDSMFGNVLSFDHLLDPDVLPAAFDEKKEKNALARSSAVEFAGRCVDRANDAGPRSGLSEKNVGDLCSLLCSKLDDSDPLVRKATVTSLNCLQALDDQDHVSVVLEHIEKLQTSHPRAYKTLARASGELSSKPSSTVTSVTKSPEKTILEDSSSRKTVAPLPKSSNSPRVPTGGLDPRNEQECAKSDRISYDVALQKTQELKIPLWDAEEDESGILAGLMSTKWLLRQDAVKSITAFVESGGLVSQAASPSEATSAIVAVVAEHTREFRETNVNIMKGILHLFTELAYFHESNEVEFPAWCTREGIQIAVSKISDKKLLSVSKEMLSTLLAVSVPSTSIVHATEFLAPIKSPVAHEEFIAWFKQSLDEFGVKAFSPALGELIPWMISELEAVNPKVKRSAHTLMGHLHRLVGPSFKALACSAASQQDTRDTLEKCFDSYGYDPALAEKEPSRISIVSENSEQSAEVGLLSLKVPSSDLLALVPEDCVRNLVSTEGKASWKFRKQALEDIEKGLRDCTGLVDSTGSKMRNLVEMMRGLRDRLSDTQINLKPVAARVVGDLLSKVDKPTQARLGKIVYSGLISSTMNDIKKPMRDASLNALNRGVHASNLDGSGLNAEAIEGFLGALVEEVNEASARASGLPELLSFVVSIVPAFPDLDTITASRGLSLSEKFSSLIVECLTSSKTETRAAATSLLEESFSNGIITYDNIRRATERLKPAKQRSIGPLIAKFSRKTDATPATSVRGHLPGSDRNPPSTREKSLTPARIPKSSRMAASPVEKMEEIHRSSAHPLEGDPSAFKRVSPTVAWPEYPEEPMGPVLLASLRKCWSPFLPKSSVQILFPAVDFRKQDDTQFGCELLRKAVSSDRENGTEFVCNQLDHVLKWISFAYGLKEATVGLQSILTLIGELFEYLIDSKKELNDGEAMILVPFILEKAFLAKGRFRDTYAGLETLLRNETLIPPKRLGGIICTALIERSTHLRVKSFAANMCGDCVDKEGLTGVGKRGVIAAAKLLSESTLPDLKAGALDLLVKVLLRMSGDMSRLSRICGPALSAKAKQELEAASKQNRKPPKVANASPTTANVKGIPSTNKSQDRRTDSFITEDRITDLEDELPAFTLRSRLERSSSPEKESNIEAIELDENPFSFSLKFKNTTRTSPSSEERKVKLESHTDEHSAKQTASPSTRSESHQNSAAALRARLMRIRERSQTDGREARLNEKTAGVNPAEEFQIGVDSMKHLLSTEVPINDENEVLVATINSLKKFHSALSGHQDRSAEEAAAFSELRNYIYTNMNTTIECLTSLVGFSFRCGEEDLNSGLSVPLLSVCLATLMALFRDSEMAFKVSDEDMVLLIREAGTALLDDRLSNSSSLDEATSSQMVRAINKLAVQAATGAARHTSFQALMTLQQQLTFDPVDGHDSLFTSRLSRVISKLFARVVKTEDESPSPYTNEFIDMEVLICIMEDTLVTCEENEQIVKDSTCSDMVNLLLRSIIRSKATDVLLSKMSELGLEESLLEPRVRQLTAEPSLSESRTDTSSSAQASSQPQSVATLVANVANAPEGPQRSAAVEQLKKFNEEKGKTELAQHLAHVSSPFRTFIEKQIGEELVSSHRNDSGSMSERLRSLRSRLQATEAAVQAAVDGNASAPSENTIPSTSEGSSPSKTLSPSSDTSSVRQSRLSRPSPSKIPGVTSQTSTSAASSLRDRLASLQDNRTTAIASDGTDRAAALRARLEAVKRQPTS